MRIAIMGGSFNPPHVAHVLAATWVLCARAVDEVWFMPVGQHAFGKSLEAFEHRFAMLEEAIAPIAARARVTDVEQRLGGPNRTIDTLLHLQKEHPGHDFSLIIGADILAERHSWKAWDVLENDFGFHILGREGHPMPEGYGAEVVLPGISSTQLRGLLAKGDFERCDGLAGRGVLEYIRRHGLYGASRPQGEGL